MTEQKKPDNPLEVKPPAPTPAPAPAPTSGPTPVKPAVAPTSTPVKEVVAAKDVKEVSRRDVLHKQISEALAQYRNLESDIPTNHPYWQWVNEYRGIK